MISRSHFFYLQIKKSSRLYSTLSNLMTSQTLPAKYNLNFEKKTFWTNHDIAGNDSTSFGRKKLVDKQLVDKNEKKLVDKFNTHQMKRPFVRIIYVNQMSVSQMSVDQMSADQLSVNQMTVSQMCFDQMKTGPFLA
jgi:hypothetical protein